jgi:hypothetical protein
MRFFGRRNVGVIYGDSRKVMTDLFAGPLRVLQQGVVFLDLDAHLEHDPPLADELRVVSNLVPEAIVVIDDFQVPFDPGYRYDKYKSGKMLTPDYIAPIVGELGLTVFYPSTLASEESGSKRGCAIVAVDARHGAKLRHGNVALWIVQSASSSPMAPQQYCWRH